MKLNVLQHYFYLNSNPCIIVFYLCIGNVFVVNQSTISKNMLIFLLLGCLFLTKVIALNYKGRVFH